VLGKVLTTRPLLLQVYCSDLAAPVQPDFQVPEVLHSLTPLLERVCRSPAGAAVAPMAAVTRTRKLVSCILTMYSG
jgi:hypothetical protein